MSAPALEFPTLTIKSLHCDPILPFNTSNLFELEELRASKSARDLARVSKSPSMNLSIKFSALTMSLSPASALLIKESMSLFACSIPATTPSLVIFAFEGIGLSKVIIRAQNRVLSVSAFVNFGIGPIS